MILRAFRSAFSSVCSSLSLPLFVPTSLSFQRTCSSRAGGGFTEQQLAQLDKLLAARLSRQDQLLGSLCERSIRKDIKDAWDRGVAEEFTARNLEDLGRLAVEAKPDSASPQAQDFLAASTSLADEILPRKAPELFVRQVRDCIERVGNAVVDVGLRELHDTLDGPWFDANGAVKVAVVHEYLNKLDQARHGPLRRQLRDVLPVVVAQLHGRADAARTQLMDGTAGIILAQYAATPFNFYPGEAVEKYEDMVMPSSTIQCDVKGKLEVLGDHAVINMGEIKRSTTGFGVGVKQLVRKLELLQWVIRRIYPHIRKCVKVGHLYMPKDGDVSQQGSKYVGDVFINLHLV